MNNYKVIEDRLNYEAKKILLLIKEDYYQYMNDNKKSLIDELIESNIVIVNQGKSIFNNNIIAHGGRTLKDDKIHFYPDTREFKSDDEVFEKCKKILPHECFHYFLQPDRVKCNEKERQMLLYYTEGLVEKETRRFCKRHKDEIEFEKAYYGFNINFVNYVQCMRGVGSYEIIFGEENYLNNIMDFKSEFEKNKQKENELLEEVEKISHKFPENMQKKVYYKMENMILQDGNAFSIEKKLQEFDFLKPKVIKSLEEKERIYNESIILIGPSGVGKSTVAKILKKQLNMPRVCLDEKSYDLKKSLNGKIDDIEKYNVFLIKSELEKIKDIGIPGICDFGAGHSVFNNRQCFEEVKKQIRNFKNIVLLLPSADIDISLQILSNRSKEDIRNNRGFITSPCNRELATITIYENGKNAKEVASEIIKTIENKAKDNIEER